MQRMLLALWSLGQISKNMLIGRAACDNLMQHHLTGIAGKSALIPEKAKKMLRVVVQNQLLRSVSHGVKQQVEEVQMHERIRGISSFNLEYRRTRRLTRQPF